MKIRVNNIPKALVALHATSQQQGMGFLRPDKVVDEAAAIERLARSTYVDYLHGRVIKVDFSTKLLDVILFDRDNGYGSALKSLTYAGLVEEVVDEKKE